MCKDGFLSNDFARLQCVTPPTYGRISPAMLAGDIGARIRAARKAKGWSLAKLAEKCDPPTTHQHISRLESGTSSLTIEWVERIAAALDIPPYALLIGPQKEQGFRLSEQVAGEVARVLVEVAQSGEGSESGTVQAVALMLQELTATFSAHPQAAADPNVALPLVDLASRRFFPVAS